MENVQKQVHNTIVCGDESEKICKLIVSPLFAGCTLFFNHLVSFRMPKECVKLDKSFYAGMVILDISKILMYDFYCNELKSQYGTKCELIYTDTDSLWLEIKTDHVYKDMEAKKNLYNTSDYSNDHLLYSSANKKVLGKTKTR